MKKAIIIGIILYTVSNVHASILLDFPHYNSRLYGSAESMLVEKGDLNNIDIFPASIASINKQSLSMGYIKWRNLLNIMRIGYAHKIKTIGVIGGSINYGSLKQVKNYDEYGNFLGDLNNNDVLVNVGYGREIKNDIQIGMNIKYLSMNVCDYKASWLGAGVSGMISLHLKSINIKKRKNLNLGLGIQNINIIKPIFDKKSSGYPVSVYGGFIYKFYKISEIEIKAGMTGTYLTKYNNFYLSTGLEFSYKNLLYLRTGYYILGRDSDKIAVGIGVEKNNLLQTKLLGQAGIKFDYSLSFLKEGTAHFVQMGFMFMPIRKYKKEDINYYQKKNIIIEEEDDDEVFFNIRENDMVLFDNYNNKLTREGRKIIDEMAELIKKEDYKRVIALIYTKKNTKQSLTISKSRAGIIIQRLIGKKIDRKRISYKIYNKKEIIEKKDFKGDYKYEILLIRWKEGEEEKFKSHYFEGMDAFIKEGYNKAIKEWRNALIIDPENQDVKRRLKEAEKQLKLKLLKFKEE